MILGKINNDFYDQIENMQDLDLPTEYLEIGNDLKKKMIISPPIMTPMPPFKMLQMLILTFPGPPPPPFFKAKNKKFPPPPTKPPGP